MPVLNLTEPAHLLAKLKHEFETLAADHSNSYAAINAIHAQSNEFFETLSSRVAASRNSALVRNFG